MFSALRMKGQGLVEYAIILALVAIVVITVMTTTGKKVCNTFGSIGNSLPPSGSSGSSNNCGTSSTASEVALSSTFTGCSGNCTDTAFTCTPGTSYNISYTASAAGGSTGTTPNRVCPAGGNAFAGNFYPGQVVTITNNSTGLSQVYTVPPKP